MKTKRFRLLTVLLAAVMMFALSMNVMAAKSNAVTKDGLTAQLFTDKDSYKAGESVKANVQVDNHTGEKVYVITQITAPDGVALENANVAFDAFLEAGESWDAVGGVVTSAGNASGATAAAGSATTTGDNMQAGFWVILTALAVGGLFALFVYGKNRTTWLSVMLCIAMIGGMVVAAVPAQAAGIEGSISLSCTIQVDGKDEVVSATVSYMSYEEDLEDTNDITEAAIPSGPSEESSEPSQESSESSEDISAPGEDTNETSEPSEDTSEPEVAVNAIYVSTTATSGEGDGSINNPFANIEEAQARVREIKAADEYPEEGITVYFREGQYRIAETILFEEADSGKEGAPVVYSAYEDEAVMFVGGIDVELSAFTAVTDEKVLAKLADEVQANIKQIDLKAMGITDYGEMNVYGAGLSYFWAADIEVPDAQAPELFFNDEAMHIARYPNADDGDGWLYIKEVIDPGDAIQNWTIYHEVDKFVPEEERTYPPKGSIFKVDDATKERIANWGEASDPWVYGYWKETWSDQSMPVESMDTETGIVKTKYPSGKTMTAGKYFYFYNMLEEVDAPGEYYLDRDNGILYFYPPQESGSVTMSLLEGNMIELTEGTHDIDFCNIELKTGRSNGVGLLGAERVNITDCDMSKFAKLAVSAKDCKDVTVSGCHLYDLGTGGVTVSYDYESAITQNMVNTLEPMGMVVENCEIHNYSRIKQTYSAAVQTAGVGMVVRNCKIYDGAHYAISMAGNETLIENNEIFDVLKSVSDSGVIYGGFNKEQMGITIRNNYVHDIYSSAGSDISIVYCDDTQDGVIVESNLFVNFSGKAVKFNGGWDNIFRNNVLINVDTAAIISDIGLRGSERYDVANGANYEKFRAVATNSAYYKYPHFEGKLDTLLQEGNIPKYNEIADNVVINTSTDTTYFIHGANWSVANIKRDNTIEASHKYGLSQIGLADIDNGKYTTENDSVLLTNGDFTLSEDSVIFTDIEGFKAYDFSKIGLIGETPEKAGPLGALEMPEELDPSILLKEDFEGSELKGWSKVVHSNNCTFEINDEGQLEVSMPNGDKVEYYKSFEAYAGTISYELDFTLNRNGSEDIDPGFILRGEGASLVGVSVFNTSGGNVFRVYEGKGNFDGTGQTVKTTKVCEDGRTYRIKVVADPATDMYDLYIDDEKFIEGHYLRSDVDSFNAIMVSNKKKTEGTVAVTYFDNIVISKSTEKVGSSNVPDGVEDALLWEDFEDGNYDDWINNGSTSTTGIKVNSGKELEFSVTEDGQKIEYIRNFTQAEGKISYEMDFTVDRNGSTVLDAGVMIARGMDESGSTSAKSLVNIKVYSDETNGKVFGAYDGSGANGAGAEHPVPGATCEDGKTYHVKLVVDTDTDTYDLYVDGKIIIEASPLRYKASAVTGITLSVKGGSAANPATVKFDDILVQKVDTSVTPTPDSPSTAITAGKKVLVIGDSLTEAGLWQQKLIEKCGMNVTTHAKGGIGLLYTVDGYESFAALSKEEVAEQDLIVLYAGYNDRWRSCGVVGDLYNSEDNSGNTIAGVLQYCINTIRALLTEAENTNCKIMIVTPHCVGKSPYGTVAGLDGYTAHPTGGATLEEICNMMVDVAEANDIPVYDLYHNSGIDKNNWNTYSKQVADEHGYIAGTTTYADQVHLNDAGYALVGDKIADFILDEYTSESDITENPVNVIPDPVVPGATAIGDELLFDNFSDETVAWTNWENMTGNSPLGYTKVSNGWLEYGVNSSGKTSIFKDFTAAQSGSISLEFDIHVQRNDSTDFKPTIMLKGKNAAGTTNTLLNIQVIAGGKFAVYQGNGSGGNKTNTTAAACNDNTTYHVKLVASSETDTYDLYIDDMTTAVITGEPLRSDTDTFTSIWIQTEGGPAEGKDAPRAFIDNVVVKKVEASGEGGGEGSESTAPNSDYVPTGEELLYDNFSGETVDWTGNIPTGFYVKYNDAEQLEVGMTADTTSNATIGRKFDAYEGKVSYEVDFKFTEKTGTNNTLGIMLVKGYYEGGTSYTTLLNIHATYDANMSGYKFNTYIAGGTNTTKNTIACESGKFYTIKAVADSTTDTYTIYVDDQVLVEGSWTGEANHVANFAGMQIGPTYTTAAVAPVLYYDNVIVQKVETSITPTPILSDDFSGETLSTDWGKWSCTINDTENTYYKLDTDNERLELSLGGTTSDNAFSSDKLEVINQFDSIVTGKVSYEFDFILNKAITSDVKFSAGAIIKGSSAGETLITVSVPYYVGGKLQVSGGASGTVSYAKEIVCAADTEYRIKLVVDTETNKFDVLVNNEEWVTGATCSKDITSLSGILFYMKEAQTAAAVPAKMYVDDVIVQKVEGTSVE